MNFHDETPWAAIIFVVELSPPPTDPTDPNSPNEA